MENGQILWEGELLTGGRKGEPVKVRIMFHRGQWLDEFGQLGPDIKLQSFDAKTAEWRKRSPHEFNAASFAIALAASR